MAKKKSTPTSAAAKAPSRCNWLLFSMDSCDVYRVCAVDYRARRRRCFRLGLRRRRERGSRRPGHLAIEVEIRGRLSGDEPRAAIEGQVLDRPFHEDDDAALELDEVLERRKRLLPAHPPRDHLSRIRSLLHRDLGHALKRLAVGAGGEIPDHEDVGM